MEKDQAVIDRTIFDHYEKDIVYSAPAVDMLDRMFPF
jgi:hypothetical protein